MEFISGFILRIASSTEETQDHFHRLDPSEYKKSSKLLALAMKLAAICPPSMRKVMLTNGVVYKIFYEPLHPKQLSLETNASDQVVVTLTNTINSVSAEIRDRADSTLPYDLESIVPNAKFAELIRVHADISSEGDIVLESHSSAGVRVIEPLDPAHLPGKRRSDDGYLSGPFLIRAIGRNWKSGSIEIHLENHIVVTLPAWPGFGADDVRQAFDSRWSLDGNIREDPQSGTWHIEKGAKLMPALGTEDFWDENT